MFNSFEKIFTSPVFDDEEKTRVASLLHRIILGAWVVPVLFAIVYLLMPANRIIILPVELVLISLLVAITATAQRGSTRTASMLLMAVLILLGLYINFVSAGEPRPAIIYYAWVIIVCGLLLGGREAISIAILFSIAQIVVVRLASNGTIRPTLAPPTPLSGVIVFSIGYLLVATTFSLASNSIQSALARIRKNEKELFIRNKDLEELARNLEERVQARTAELQKRSAQMQTVSSVARTIASVQDINDLLPDITKLVSEQFGFYHVGIFLVDANNEYAILSAANSEGGAKMLSHQHRLKLDSNSIVGFTTSLGEPRIALDVGADSVYFDNPYLPETRSEMALPLRVGDKVIGALDVQSKQTNAFMQEDISVLATLADQVAIAIENARLFSESRRALAESKATFERYAQQDWNSFARQIKHSGFAFDGKQITPLDNHIKRDQIRSATQTGSLAKGKATTAISVPIKFRGQIIGVLDVRSKKGQRTWTQDEITLLEAAAERAALALENARLVESAQRRASRERAIGEISAKIGTVSDMDSILQTAVEELGRKISGTAEVVLELNIENE